MKGGVAMIPQFLVEALNNFIFFILHVDSNGLFPKPLSKDEEAKCFKEMSDGSKKARAKLIEHNLRLVAHIIKKYYSLSADQEELISIGTIGLIKAVSTFDYSKGNRFATYGSKCIENEILMHFRSLKKTAGDVSIDDPINTDKDGNQLTQLDLCSDGSDILEEIDLKVKSEQLYKFLSICLDKREYEIIVNRYGLFGFTPLTQREVAQKLDISRSYVSRIEKKALASLKKMYDKN